MKKLVLFLFLLGGICPLVIAQDLLIKLTDEVVKCKITEIGSDEIHYKLPNYREDLCFSIDKNLVKKIILAEGDEINIEDSMFGKGNYERQHKNALKISFFSPLSGNTNFTYERSLAPGKSMEFTLGIIGLGMDNYDINGQGAFLKAGYKLIKSPDFYLKGMRYAHLLKGIYFRPEIAISAYSYEDYYYNNYYYGGYGYSGSNNYDVKKEDTNIMLSFLLNVGKQWVFNDLLVLDLFVGAGYGFGKNDRDNSYHYAFVGACDGVPLTLTSGLRIGFLFK